MRRTVWLLSVVFVFSVGLFAQSAQQRAFNNGYQAGYNQGYNDAQAGDVPDVAGSPVFQQAMQGWTGVLDRGEYRNNFRAGFRDGYQTGFRDASNGVSTNTTPIGGQQFAAFSNGYSTGYAAGQRDAGAVYSLEANPVFRQGTLGFDASRFTSLEAYRTNFKQGFQAGYSDGYYGRAYDARYNIPRLDQQGGQISGEGYYPYAASGYGSGYSRAYDVGYQQGYAAGQNDQGGAFEPRENSAYRNGTIGYNPATDGSRTSYRDRFREGFLAGYSDGYYGRVSRGGFGYGPRGVGPYTTGQGPVLAMGRIVVPAGTVLQLQLNNSLSTKTDQPGNRFTATVTQPVLLPGTNEVAIPQGAVVHGTVVNVQRGGSLTGKAEMNLRYDTISLPQAGDYRLFAETEEVGNQNVATEGQVQGGQSTTRTIGEVAAGTAIGALIGGIAGGGTGAGIGAAVGTGAGLGVVFATRGRDINLDAGTPMQIRLDRPLDLMR